MDLPAVEIKFDKKKLRQLERELRGVKNGMPKVICRAINKTAAPAKTQISKEIRAEINTTAKRVNQRLKLKKANFGNWAATIHISSLRLPLRSFATNWPGKNKKAKRKIYGVTYKIRKMGGSKKIESGFIATMKSGHEGIFKRKNKSHLPIVELFGPSVAVAFDESASLVRRVTANAYTRLDKNIQHELDYVLGRIKSGRKSA